MVWRSASRGACGLACTPGRRGGEAQVLAMPLLPPVGGAEALLCGARAPDHGRSADLRRARQRRRVGAPGTVLPETKWRTGKRGRRAARLFQRHRAVMGQSALPLGGARAHRLPVVDRAPPIRVRTLSTSAALITSAVLPPTGRSRPGKPPLSMEGGCQGRERRCSRPRNRPWGSFRSWPKISASSPRRRGSPQPVRFPGHEHLTVRLRERSAGARFQTAQLSPQPRCLYRHARQRHDRGLVDRQRRRATARAPWRTSARNARARASTSTLTDAKSIGCLSAPCWRRWPTWPCFPCRMFLAWAVKPA